MKSEYYQKELSDLRELALDFAKAHPAIAPQLSGPTPDPDVERILEGVAFLTGQIRETLDQNFPEFAQGLLQQIFPNYLRPMPSATIVEFIPRSILKTNLIVPSGTTIDSNEVEGVKCRFSTCYDVDVAPIQLEQVIVDSSGSGRYAIDLDFSLQGLSLSDWESDRLRLYLGGDYHGASDLYYLLLRALDRMIITPAGGGRPHYMEAKALTPLGLEQDEALFSYPSNAFPAYRLIQEYWLLKEKFLFVELKGLNQWENRGSGSRFTIRFDLYDAPIQLPRLSKESFVLHATPALNLFAHHAEPLLLDHRRNEVRIRPGRDSGGKYQVYSVDRVTGHSRRTSKKMEYAPVGMVSSEEQTVPVYQVAFKKSASGNGNIADPYLSISYPKEYGLPEQETLTIELTCTNGPLPASLRPGDVSKPTASTSELVFFRNILPPTDSLQPPTDGSLLWQLLSHLSLNYLSVADVKNLKALLSLYIFSGTNRRNELANRRRVDGILDVKVMPSDRLVAGLIMRGQDIEVSVNRDHFASYGDLYLFGSVLDRLFASFSNINTYSALILKEANTGEQITWSAKLGDRPLI